MTCGIESHWPNYNPNCHSCRAEVKDWTDREVLTVTEQEKWLAGKLRIPLR